MFGSAFVEELCVHVRVCAWSTCVVNQWPSRLSSTLNIPQFRFSLLAELFHMTDAVLAPMDKGRLEAGSWLSQLYWL